MKYIYRNCILLIYFIGLVFPQPIPQDHFYFKSKTLLYDAGTDWNSLSCFGPIRFQQYDKSKKNRLSNSSLNGRIGFYNKNQNILLYTFNKFYHKEYFYGYLFSRFKIDENIFENPIGDRTNQSNESFKSREVDLSGIGFQNDWLVVQIGKGRQSWGSGKDIQLALSRFSNSYDYFLLGSDYGKIRVRYIHGFLESTLDQINRYITARGMEYFNKNMILGFSETVIYSGLNRSIDMGYINPISSHLEVDLNNRLNFYGDQYSNGVWQIHADVMLKSKIRIAINYLIDEFVLDPEIEVGAEHGDAYSARISYTPLFSENHMITIFSSMVEVGTSTFRHGIGTNNFVSRERPLGWRFGSDGNEKKIGINYFNLKDLIISLSIMSLKIGEESTIYRTFDSYQDYLKGPFPSGDVKNINLINVSLEWWYRKYISLTIDGELEIINDTNQTVKKIDLGFNIHFPYHI